MIRLILSALFALAAWQAEAQTLTPDTLRAIEAQVITAGQPATLTCAPGIYPTFFRAAKFSAPVTAKCDGATFPGATLQGATNFILDGGTFTGRLIVANFKSVAIKNVRWENGYGILARSGQDFAADGNVILHSGGAINLQDVTGAVISRNIVHDFSGNAAISAYGGGNLLFDSNVVTGWRIVAKGVHPDPYQTANAQTGYVIFRNNVAVLPGQGIFGGGTPDTFEATGNVLIVSFPNGVTWKSRLGAKVGGNTLLTLPMPGASTPRLMGYAGPTAVDSGGNTVNGLSVNLR